MPYVYAGRLLRLDLTTGQWEDEPITEDQVRNWLLGSGLAAKLFYDEMDPQLDPLDPANPLLIFNGLLTGTAAPTGCRTSFCGRSPLTGIWNEANVGGFWGAELRFAGYDGLIITGQAQEPVYLWLDGRAGVVEIRPAAALWGLDCYETVERIQAETEARAQAACIGPAGENLVRLASVMIGGRHGRAAGRGGMGALMGAKNLKAIAVRGTSRPEYRDREGLLAYVREINAWIKDNSLSMSRFGTAGGMAAAEVYGDLPVQNWRLGSWPEGAEAISGQRIAETIFARHWHCFACPIGCGKEVRIEEGPYAGLEGHGPEYETLAGFGAMCLNDDLEAIAQANDLCNRYGLDTISTSAVIAFAIEARERGLLSAKEADGLDLAWGNAEAIIQAVGKIARREGLGDLLADGVRAAAARLGDQAADLAIHVKGLEVPYHDPRAFTSMAVNYATANRGACHLEALSYWPGYGILFPELGYAEPVAPHTQGKARMARDFQDYLSVFNPLGLCKFIAKGGVEPSTVARLVNLALGWDWTAGDVIRMGEKLFNLKRLIVLRYGLGRQDDTLPSRLLTPRPSGAAAGVVPDLDSMLAEYYRLRGWDEKGAPTREKLRELGLM
ncbi:MAG: aldehyde ferredoxin oxidoreductase family protein [Anaerolineae bacterium]